MDATLYHFVPAWGLPDLSPWCVNVDAYLRMAGVPVESKVADLRQVPEQELPCVEDDARRVCESRDIIAHFEAKAAELRRQRARRRVR